MNYILFDLEAIGENSNKDFMEIIEIAAYKVSIKNDLYMYNEFMRKKFKPQCLIVDKFHSYIKPIFHSKISKKINKLTHISDEELSNAKYYVDVIKEFIKWAGEDVIFVTWSSNDKEMIEINNENHMIYDFPLISYLDLQQEYDKVFMKRKRTSLSTAINEIGVEFDGRCHNADDDSYNMIPILQNIVFFSNKLNLMC